jgi:hypothetical protein
MERGPRRWEASLVCFSSKESKFPRNSQTGFKSHWPDQENEDNRNFAFPSLYNERQQVKTMLGEPVNHVTAAGNFLSPRHLFVRTS